MPIKINAEAAFEKGLEAFNQGNINEAKIYFLISIEDIQFKKKSLFRLIWIDLKQGKYARARATLAANPDLDFPRRELLYGLLENIESNYETSKKYYTECLSHPASQKKALLALARLSVQTKDYELAHKMYETLEADSSDLVFYLSVIESLVTLTILEKDYETGIKLIKKLSEHQAEFNTKYSEHDLRIKYLLGQAPSPYLNDCDETSLLNHIASHLNQADRYHEGCFFKYLDIKKLLADVRTQIESKPAHHHGIMDLYQMQLDTPIGFKEDEITRDLCVATILGTSKIITMYPVSLSPEFNREGSPDLALKKERRKPNGCS